jgi:hypothetical protein
MNLEIVDGTPATDLRKRRTRSGLPAMLAVGAALAGVSTAVHAGLVLESENNGQMANNSLASAQSIAPGAFTVNNDPNVFGSFLTATVSGKGGLNDVDFYCFQAGAGDVYFDIDSPAFTFDTYLALFDASGTLLADNDDSFPADPGSSSDADAFLGSYSLSAKGTYYIAVSTSGNFAKATFAGDDFFELARPDGQFGGFGFVGSPVGNSLFEFNGGQFGLDYTLHITTVPGPGGLAALALASAVSSLTGRPLRRRSR